MKLRTLMIIKAVVCLVLGVVILIVPKWMYGLFGIELDGATTYPAREYGAAMIGILFLCWFARDSVESVARRAALLGLFVYDAIGAVITLVALLMGQMNALGWLVFALYLLLAVGFGYFYFKKPVE